MITRACNRVFWAVCAMSSRVYKLYAIFFFALSVVHAGPFGYYPTYGEMDSLISLWEQQHPDLVERISLSPATNENRIIYAVKISNSPGTDNGKPQALIIGVQHAAEPIGAAVIRDDIQYLLDNYGEDPEVTWLVDNRQMYFVPIANPDGYIHIENGADRLYRLNRRRNADGTYGVDLNRNFPYKWGYDDVHSSGEPGAFTYRGTEPASEPETKAMMNLVNANRFRTWQNHHSANDVLEYPWDYDYTVELPPHHLDAYLAICDEQMALYARYTECGPSYIVYDGWALNGGTTDWGHSDSSTYQIYTMITELGRAQWESDAAARSVSQLMRWADLYMAQAAGFFPVLDSSTVIDNCSACNNDGILNGGETVRFVTHIRNKSVVDTIPNVTGHLMGSASLQPTDSLAAYGTVPRLARADNTTDVYEAYVSPATAEGPLAVAFQITWSQDNVDYQKTLWDTVSVGPTLVPVGSALPLLNAFKAVVQEDGVSFHLPEKGAAGSMLRGALRATLRIYNPRKLVWESPDLSGVAGRDLRSSNATLRWDLRSSDGEPVSPGLYIAVLETPSGSVSQKFNLHPNGH